MARRQCGGSRKPTNERTATGGAAAYCKRGVRQVRSGANVAIVDSSMETMRRSGLFIIAVCSATAFAVAAQPVSPPAKPYALVPITLPAASTDANFTAFRKELAAVAKARVYIELSRLVQPQGFFWDRDFAHGFDPRKPAVDNLAAAIALERGNGSGWKLLAAMAAETAIEPLVSRPGVFCAPAQPGYDGIALAHLLDATHTSANDWAYPRADDTPVQVAPKRGSAVLGKLGMHFVHLLEFEGANGEPAPERKQWARVATPDAKIGFVAPGSLMSLTSERLCYINDLVDGWRITGYIAGGE
jgi:hypothetical protein